MIDGFFSTPSHPRRLAFFLPLPTLLSVDAQGLSKASTHMQKAKEHKSEQNASHDISSGAATSLVSTEQGHQ